MLEILTIILLEEVLRKPVTMIIAKEPVTRLDFNQSRWRALITSHSVYTSLSRPCKKPVIRAMMQTFGYVTADYY